jgi:hypothetical protein
MLVNFLLIFSDEIIKLDDFVKFRMELEAFPNLNTEDLFLEFNLIFSNRYYSSNEDKFDGKPVSQVKIKINELENGIICYSEVDFKNQYFSKASFSLYGQLMFYKF